MKVFSKILVESTGETFAITSDDFSRYAKVIEKTKRSKDFISLLWLVGQYEILFNQETLENVLKGNFINSDTLPISVQKDIYKLGKKIKDEVKLLPQLLSVSQREAVINKKIDPNDLTLDLETERGRNEIAKKYMPLIHKLVKQYENDSALSKEDLLSAALEGLTYAMNEYKNPEELAKLGKSGDMSFTSYAAYRIKQAILKEMTDNSRNVKISNYYQDKLKDSGEDTTREFSIDRMFASSDDDKPMSIDRFFGLSEEDSILSMKEKEEIYQKIFKRIESKFSSRDCTILYKAWGANGYKREKVKDIAKELGISSPAVVQACGRIMKFIASDKYCQELYSAYESLADDYVVGKLLEVYKEDKKTIVESLIYDDLYILLESLRKWNNKDKFQKTINKATDELNVDDALFIYRILQNKELLDAQNVKKYKDSVVRFLENIYPDQSFKTAKIEELDAELNDLKTISLKFAIAW